MNDTNLTSNTPNVTAHVMTISFFLIIEKNWSAILINFSEINFTEICYFSRDHGRQYRFV